MARRWLILAMVLAAVGAACGGAAADTGDASTTVAPATTVATTAAPAPTTPPVAETASSDAQPEPEGPEPIEGTVSFGQFSSEVTLVAEQPWELVLDADGVVILEDPDRAKPFTRAVLLLRVIPGEGAIPAEGIELDQWIAAQDAVKVVDQTETTVGGMHALVYDLTYSEEGEAPIVVNEQIGPVVVRAEEYYRVWTIDIGDPTPLVAFAPVAADDEAWLARADALVESIEFGEPTDEPPGGGGFEPEFGFATGDLAFDVGGGTLQLSVPEEIVYQHMDPRFLIIELQSGTGPTLPAVVFIAPQQTGDGTPLPDASAIRESFAEATTLSDGPTTTILGQDVTAVVAEERLLLPALSTVPVGEDPSQSDANTTFYGYDYLIDTEHGPLLIGVAASSEADLVVVGEFFDEVAPSIAFL